MLYEVITGVADHADRLGSGRRRADIRDCYPADQRHAQRHVAEQDAGVDGEVVHALLGLLDQGVRNNFV